MPITINGTTGISGVDGSAATPPVTGADTDTGIFFPAVNTVAISTSGIEKVRIAANGNIGIGTTTPSVTLEVNGAVKVSGNLVSSSTSYVSNGFSVIGFSLGTGSGTVTPAAGSGNYQYITNNAAFTIAAPTTDCAVDIIVTNGATAGAITFTGFKTPGVTVSGSTYATTASTFWVLSIRRVNSIATYNWNGPWT